MYHHPYGNFDKSFVYMKRALYILETICGSEHPDIASIYLNLGHMYHEIGHTAPATDLMNQALYKFMAMYGENNLSVALAYQSIANVQTNFWIALENQEKCHNILTEIYKKNENHPLLVQNRAWIQALTELCVKQEKEKESDTGRQIGENKPRMNMGHMLRMMAANPAMDVSKLPSKESEEK